MKGKILNVVKNKYAQAGAVVGTMALTAGSAHAVDTAAIQTAFDDATSALNLTTGALILLVAGVVGLGLILMSMKRS